MKMKSFLLGSAAGFVAASLAAISGAQAADLPVKARAAAQYVKTCTLYGKRFYYIPGTDTCIRIGGYVRADYHYNARGGGTPSYRNGGGFNNGRRTLTDESTYATRHRGILVVDARSQSAYGTVRSLIQLGFSNQNQQSSSGPSIYFSRAFIQFAGSHIWSRRFALYNLELRIGLPLSHGSILIFQRSGRRQPGDLHRAVRGRPGGQCLDRRAASQSGDELCRCGNSGDRRHAGRQQGDRTVSGLRTLI